MTARPSNRGGRRVPDGIPRPSALPFGQGPNRTDLSALPGTPGTELPSGPMVAGVPQGQTGQIRRALSEIPLQQFATQAGGLRGQSAMPTQPVTAGIGMGPGGGPESLIQQPNEVSNEVAAKQLQYMYPLIMRLATMPHSTTQTKILAQKLRATLPVQPERMPRTQAPVEVTRGLAG